MSTMQAYSAGRAAGKRDFLSGKMKGHTKNPYNFVLMNNSYTWWQNGYNQGWRESGGS